MNKALLLVDFQNEWTNQESEYFLGNITELIEKTNKLIDFSREKQYKIIFITHIENESETSFSINNNSTEVIAGIHKSPSDIVVKKYKISPFYKTTLEHVLEGCNEVVICGILSNLCVRSAIQDAYDRDFKVTVIIDCCTAFDTETQEFTFQDLKSTREEIDFATLHEYIGSTNHNC